MPGIVGHIGYARETAWGTPVAATDYVKALSEGFVHDIERFEDVNIHGGLHEPDDNAGLNRYGGDLVAAGHPRPMGHLLFGVMGVNAPASITSALWQNVFTMAVISDAISSLHPLPAYTFEIFRPGAGNISTGFQIAGAQVAALGVGFAPNQDVRLSATLVGKTRAALQKTTPSFPATPTAAFHWDTTSIQIAGAAVDRVEALNVSFDNQLEGIPSLNNSSEIAKIRRNGPQLIRLSGTAEFVDRVDYDAFVNQTEQRIVASVKKPNSFSLVMDFPRCVFNGYPVQIPGRERITVDFEMMARYHTGSGNAGKVTLIDVTTIG